MSIDNIAADLYTALALIELLIVGVVIYKIKAGI